MPKEGNGDWFLGHLKQHEKHNRRQWGFDTNIHRVLNKSVLGNCKSDRE
jgi:hypothetical protein